jgi:hypothetical protein
MGGGARKDRVMAREGGKDVEIIDKVVSFLVGLAVMALMLKVILPTKLDRAVLITFLYTLIFIVVAGVVGAIVFAVYGFGFKRT